MLEWLDFSAKIAGIATPIVIGAIGVFFAKKRLHFDRENIRIQRDNDIIKWSADCIFITSQIEHLNPSFLKIESAKWNERNYDLNSRLSALIDHGRMFLPNSEAKVIGVSKESAFRGYRHDALDRLVWIYDIAKEQTFDEYSDKARFEINKNRREFVSIVQSEVDPERRISFIKSEHVSTQAKTEVATP